MTFSENMVIVGAVLLAFFGGYGLYLKRQADRDIHELDRDLKAPPAE